MTFIGSLVGYLVGVLAVILGIAGGIKEQAGNSVAGAILILASMIVLMNFLHWNERRDE